MSTPIFSGPSFQINPISPSNNQNSPAIAALDDGRFVTVYRSDDINAGTLRYVIHNADGTVAREETIVDPDNEDFVDNEMVDIAALAGGGFVVTWSQRSGADENIFHRVYGENGLPVTGPIHSNADTTDGIAKRPDVIGDGKGGFYLVWDDSSFDSDPGPGQTFTRSVRMQHFGANGQPTGPSAMLSDTMGGDSNAAIAINRDGTRVNVIWDDDIGNEGSHSDGIYGVEIGGAGGFYRADKGAFSEFHADPDIAYSTGNTFMTVWSEFVPGFGQSVYGSINGGAEFQINTTGHSHAATMQKVVGLRDGNFLVVWYDGGHGGNDDVLGQLISSSGAKIGDEFVISDRPSIDINRINATETIDGRVMVSWASSDGPSEVYGRMIDPRLGGIDWTGDESAEQFAGTRFVDTLHGADGDDVLQGLAGGDIIDGGNGNDTASYDLASAGVLASLASSGGNMGDAEGDSYSSIENLTGSQFGDSLFGDDSLNILRGLGGNDYIRGGGGSDLILAGDGEDMLVGDQGGDYLTGGNGRDTFFYNAAGDSTAKARDVIADFIRNQDEIHLDRIDANENRRRDQDFEFIGTQKFHKEAGELRYEVKKGNAVVMGDTDGDGRADFAIELSEVNRLRASDFDL